MKYLGKYSNIHTIITDEEKYYLCYTSSKDYKYLAFFKGRTDYDAYTEEYVIYTEDHKLVEQPESSLMYQQYQIGDILFELTDREIEDHIVMRII